MRSMKRTLSDRSATGVMDMQKWPFFELIWMLARLDLVSLVMLDVFVTDSISLPSANSGEGY